MIADRRVAADLAVVGVHVVHGEAQVAEAVAEEAVLPAGEREDAVPAEADVVALHPRAWRVPDRDTVAVQRHLPAAPAGDDVAAYHRPRCAMDVDAEEVALDPVALG